MAKHQLLLRKNKVNKDGKHPLIFKVYLGNKTKIITLPFSCTKDEWDIINKRFKRKHPKYRIINDALKKLDTRLQNSIDELEAQEVNYDLQDIERVFKEEAKANKVKLITVSKFILNRVEELEEEGRFGYAKIIKDTHTSLFKFAKKDLKFKQITPEFLDKYEHFLRKSYDDVGIKIRMTDIRTAFNRAITHGYTKPTEYPFKVYKISKLKSNSRKIAITKEEFEAFKSFDIEENSKYENTYKMFLFSYYAWGMNFKDITFLRWSNVNISEALLEYKRDKTKGNFNLPLREEAIEILKYFKNYPTSENSKFIFPIINKQHLTEKQIHGRYKRCLKKFNKQLKFIAESVGIEKSLTSYVARHSMATHLKFNGVSESVISQSMGHSSEAITKAYLEDFGSPVLEEAMKQLN